MRQFHRQYEPGLCGRQAKGSTDQKLLVGPWVHGLFTAWAGELDFGRRAWVLLDPPEELRLRWFGHWLKDLDNGIMEEPPIRIFVMGENTWRFENEWPLARTEYTPYHLHSGGAANSLRGDGTLPSIGPEAELVDTFVYDPRNPVPTRGGGLCCWQPALPSGAYDQREIEARPDGLVYTTPPLQEDVEATGPVEVHLWAATSAPDTDFTAKLVDVGPGDYARNIHDGILRAPYRLATAQAEPIRPGEAYEYTIDLAATSNVFKGGHRIRVEISSSNFPRVDRNPNTGRAIGEDTELRPAVQTVFDDVSRPSRILLPIIPV